MCGDQHAIHATMQCKSFFLRERISSFSSKLYHRGERVSIGVASAALKENERFAKRIKNREERIKNKYLAHRKPPFHPLTGKFRLTRRDRRPRLSVEHAGFSSFVQALVYSSTALTSKCRGPPSPAFILNAAKACII